MRNANVSTSSVEFHFVDLGFCCECMNSYQNTTKHIIILFYIADLCMTVYTNYSIRVEQKTVTELAGGLTREITVKAKINLGE